MMGSNAAFIGMQYTAQYELIVQLDMESDLPSPGKIAAVVELAKSASYRSEKQTDPLNIIKITANMPKNLTMSLQMIIVRVCT